MEQTGHIIQALLAALACVSFYLFQRYEPFKNWALHKLLSWSMGWSAAVHLSKAFDSAGHMSLRSHVINWAGFVIVVFLLIRWQQTSKKAKPGAV